MLINIIGFQIGWFACVLGGANQMAWIGAFIGMAIILRHIKTSFDRESEIKLISFAMVFGFFFDLIPLSLSWIEFADVSYWPNQLPPPWMTVLWGLFATTLNISLRWLKNQYLLSTFIGGISGPIAYWSGSKLGALSLTNFDAAILFLAVGWAIAVPFLVKFNAKNQSSS
jgi:hypothetical protein